MYSQWKWPLYLSHFWVTDVPQMICLLTGADHLARSNVPPSRARVGLAEQQVSAHVPAPGLLLGFSGTVALRSHAGPARPGSSLGLFVPEATLVLAALPALCRPFTHQENEPGPQATGSLPSQTQVVSVPQPGSKGSGLSRRSRSLGPPPTTGPHSLAPHWLPGCPRPLPHSIPPSCRCPGSLWGPPHPTRLGMAA